MQIIKPSQISGEIMTLIEEADEKLILVSPYCNFSNWKKLKRAIDFAKRKDIEIEFYIRKGESKTFQSVKNEGFNPIEIENLHTKLYFNERYAIITSMNLLEYSDMNSLDIGYKTETQIEYEEIIDYYNRYLASNTAISPIAKEIVSTEAEIELNDQREWLNFMRIQLSKKINKNFYFKFEGSRLKIAGPNLYYCHISYDQGIHHLNIVGILSQSEREHLENNNYDFVKNFKNDINLYTPEQTRGYNEIWHHSTLPLKSVSLDFMNKKEYSLTAKIIIDFIVSLEKFKANYWA